MTPSFVFIVGRGRSGSTLLQAMLDAHPDMAIPPETHLVAVLGRRRSTYERRSGFDLDRFLKDVTEHWGFPALGISPEELAEAVRGAGSTADALRAAFSTYARRWGKGRFGDKTPINVLHMPLIAGLFPEARFVHIIRDGRDVALSYRDRRGVGLVEAAYRWRRDVRVGRRDGARLGPGRYREVRYEALVRDPEGVVRDLCPFLELSFDPRMLRPQEVAERVIPSSMRAWHPHLAQPPTEGLRSWQRQMPDGEVALFEAIAGDLLDELGYARGHPSPGVGLRLAALGRVAGFQAERIFRRAVRRWVRPQRRWHGQDQETEPVGRAAATRHNVGTDR
ncbi:MAG: sulfotransferase family protein [Actinomycetota bacterium]